VEKSQKEKINITNRCFMQGCTRKVMYKAIPKKKHINDFGWMVNNCSFYCSNCKSYQEKHNSENWLRFEKLRFEKI